MASASETVQESTNAPPPSPDTSQKRRRALCSRCDRPTPSSCICVALPEEPLHLKRCHCLVLQHPHEARRKNRSLPFVQHCLDEDSLTVAVSRRFGSATRAVTGDLLETGSRNAIWLVYPSPDAISLSQALERHRQRAGNDEKITLLFLDATWKFAKEMDKANTVHRQYPDRMLRVQLDESDLEDLKQPRRFEIRTPISEQHLSTAECLAWTVAQVEDRPELYETMMRPLDLMVQQWNSFSKQTKKQKTAA